MAVQIAVWPSSFSLCTTAHPLSTRVTKTFGASVSEPTTRANPRPAPARTTGRSTPPRPASASWTAPSRSARGAATPLELPLQPSTAALTPPPSTPAPARSHRRRRSARPASRAASRRPSHSTAPCRSRPVEAGAGPCVLGQCVAQCAEQCVGQSRGACAQHPAQRPIVLAAAASRPPSPHGSPSPCSRWRPTVAGGHPPPPRPALGCNELHAVPADAAALH
jgi:hypothetical protein